MSTTPDAPSTPRDARAQAKADKAYSKAQRPWFKKKRFILPLLLILLIIIVTATSGGDSKTPAAGSGAAADAPVAVAPAFGKAQNGNKMSVSVAQVTPCTKGKPSCTVALTFANSTKEVQDELIDRSDVVLIDAQDRRFEAPAAFDAATVQPGGTKRVQIAFTDLPADFVPKSLEVDSAGAQFTIAYK